MGASGVTTGSAVIQAVGSAPELCLQPLVLPQCNQATGLGPVDATLFQSGTASSTGSGSANAGSGNVPFTSDTKSVAVGPPTPPQCGSALTGKATDGAGGTGNGVGGVVVTLLDAATNQPILDASSQPITATTASDGTYSFGDLKPGGYKVSFPSSAASSSVNAQTASGGSSSVLTSQAAVSGTSISGLVELAVGTAGVVNGQFVVNPVAVADTQTGKQGATQTYSLLANDTASTGASYSGGSTAVKLCSSGQVAPNCTATSLVTAGQGQYSVSGATVTFTPCNGVNTPVMTPACTGVFTGTASAVAYQSTDSAGRVASSTITPTVIPVPSATADTSTGAWNTAQAISPLANDLRGNAYDATYPLVASTMGICAGSTSAASSCTGTTPVTTADGTYSLNTSTGVVTFTPSATFTGVVTAPIKYAAADSLGQRVMTTITPSVTAPPVPSAASERKVVSPGDSVAFSTITGPSGLATSGGPAFTTSQTFLCGISPVETAPACTKTSVATSSGTYTLNQTTGVVTFAANANAPAENQTPVTYVVKDALGRTASSTLTPVIPGPPVVAADVNTGPWDTNQVLSPLGNDSSPTSTLVTSSLKLCGGTDVAPNCTQSTLAVANEGTYTVNANGTVTFDPLPAFAANATQAATPVTYSITDANGLTSSTTITPTVTAPANPTAADETKPVLPGASVAFSPLMGTGGLSTSGGPALASVCLITPGSSSCEVDGVVEIAGEGTYTLDPVTNVVTYAPVAGFAGTPTPLTYQVTDALGHTDTGVLTPTIPPAPTAVTDASRGEQGFPQTASLLANDAAGATSAPLDPSTVKICAVGSAPCTGTADVTIANEGTYHLNADGTVTFTPVAGFVGPGTGIDYTVADSLGRTVSATYEPTVLPKPAPIANPDALSGAYGTPLSFTPLAGNGSTADSAGTQPAATSTVLVTGLTLDASSLKLCSAGQVPPNCTATSVTTVDGTYVLSGSTVTFTGAASFSGVATAPVTYQVANAYTTVTIDPSSTTTSAPTTTDPTVSCAATPGCTITPVADADGTLPDGTGGDGTYTPTWTTTQAATTSTAGTQVASATLTPTITVTPVAAVADTASTPWNTAVTKDVLANDTLAGTGSAAGSTLKLCGPNDGATCAQTSVTVAGQGTYDVVSGQVRFTPLTSFTGAATPITYAATDALGRTVSSMFTPTVAEPTPPTATADAKSVAAGQTVAFATLLAGGGKVTAGANPVTDAATCLLTPGTSTCAPSTTVVTADGTYVLDTTTGVVQFTANANATAGAKTPISYQVTDSFGKTATSTLTPTIYAKPAPAPKTGTDLVNTAQTFDLLAGATVDAAATSPTGASVLLCGASDVAPACTALTVTNAAGTYTLDPATGVVTFTPVAGFTGTAPALTYALTDSLGQQAASTITATVVPLPTPAATDDTATAASGTPITFQPNLNDSPGTAAASVTGLGFNLASIQLCDVTPTLQAPPNCTATTVTTVDGTYVLDPATGAVTFTGAPGFTGTATNPVRYQIANTYTANGTPGSSITSALLIPTITPPPPPPSTPPASSPPSSSPTTPETQENEESSVQTAPVSSPSVAGQAPAGLTPPVTGLPVRGSQPVAAPATRTVWVDPAEPVMLDPVALVRPSAGERVDAGSLRLWDGQRWTTSVDVPGVGTWQVVDGKVMFTPRKGFTGNATIRFSVRDTAGKAAKSLLTVCVKPRFGDVPSIIDAGRTGDGCPSDAVGGPAVGTVRVGDVHVPIKAFAYQAGGVMRPPGSNHVAGVSLRHRSLDAKHGTTVIAWHVRYGPSCDGDLNALLDLPVGERFTIRSASGAKTTYEITERVTVDKGDYPRSWFRLDGPKRLALFTCADLINGQFTSTTATFARPVTTSAS